jgi:LPXTG-motif cell wall-anchored protein
VTGADALGLLAASGTLLLVGAGAVVVARRRASAP